MKRYYLSYRSDNYMAVVVFSNLYAAKKFTEKRREVETASWITWSYYSKVMTQAEAKQIGKIYKTWRRAAKEKIALPVGENKRIWKRWGCK